VLEHLEVLLFHSVPIWFLLLECARHSSTYIKVCGIKGICSLRY
jgi:hypothetical protein